MDTVNDIQAHFDLKLQGAPWLHNGERRVDPYAIAKKVRAWWKREPKSYSVAIVNNPLQGNFFSIETRDVMVVTVWDWEALYIPPSMKVYLAYQLAAAMIVDAADISEEMDIGHDEDRPIGCIFDNFIDKEYIKLGMVGANLCGECESKLTGLGVGIDALRSIESVLGYVRNNTIRRPTDLPTHVFIGHGRSDQWEQLSRYLIEDLGLSVEEFNREAVAGYSTSERLMQMLERSRCAFIVMTGEDTSGGKKHARPNVVHEIGMFHGRLGFKKTIILLEDGCEPFSNIGGLTYVSFPRGKILDDRVKTEIRRTLERERIIEPTSREALRRSHARRRTQR